LETILKVVKTHLSPQQITTMIDLLESIESCVSGYCLQNKTPLLKDTSGWKQKNSHDSGYATFGNSNCFTDAIRIMRPDYSKEDR